MRRHLTIVCIAVIACSARLLWAEERPLHSQLYLSWIAARTHFELAGGRVVNGNGNWNYGVGSRTVAEGDSRETVTFNNNGTSGSVAYTYQRVKADNHKDTVIELALEASSEGRFVLRFLNKEEPQSYFELTQAPREPVRLLLPPADKPRVLEAPTVWHLLVIHADDCRKELLPRLESVRPDWQIGNTAAAAEDELVKLAASAQKRDRQQWAAWVDQLGDPLCTRRERAERDLQEAGPVLLGFLGRLDTQRLDAEQQARIQRVIRTLSTQQGEDTPEIIAAMLVGDPNVWLALLSRDDIAKRRAAVQQLELFWERR